MTSFRASAAAAAAGAALAAAIGLGAAGTAGAAGTVGAGEAGATPVGLWRAPAHHGVIEVSRCGEALCGRLLSSDEFAGHPDLKDFRNADPSLRGRPLKGLELFYGVKGGPKEWTGGSVYNPEDGKTYHGSITLVDADTLKLTGCVIAPFCRSQVWKRLPPAG